MKFIKIVNSVFQLCCFGTPIDGVREEIYISVQRELVHRIDSGQVI